MVQGSGPATPLGGRNADASARGGALIVGILSLTVVAIGVWNLRRHGIWLDEAYTLSFTMADRSDFANALHRLDGPIVLYYLIVRGWISMFGHPVESGRLLSVLFSALAIPAIYLLGARLATRKAGIVSAVFLAANTSFWLRVDNLRMYSLALFLSVCSYLLFTQLALGPRSRPALLVAGAAFTNALLFGIQAVSGSLQLVAQAACVALVPPRRRRVLLVSIGTSDVLIAIAAAAMLPLGATETGWTVLTSPLFLIDAFALFGTHLAFVLLAVAATIALVRRPREVTAPLLLTWAATPLLAGAAVSLVRPILIDRYVLGVLPPVAILAAMGIFRLERRYAFTLAASILAAEVAGTWHVDSVPHEDWNVAARSLLRRVEPGDVVDVFPRDGAVGLTTVLQLEHERFSNAIHLIPRSGDREWMRNDTVDFVRARKDGYRGTFPRAELTDDNSVWIVLRNPLLWPPPVGYESLLRSAHVCSVDDAGIRIVQYRRRCNRAPAGSFAARYKHG